MDWNEKFRSIPFVLKTNAPKQMEESNREDKMKYTPKNSGG